MLLKELKESLKRIKNVSVAASDDQLIIANTIQGFTAKVHFEEVDTFSPIVTPGGDRGIQIFYNYEGGLIVTENDYLFDTQQGPFFTVPNLPQFCTLSMVIDNFLSYCQNPTPSIHTHKNLNSYYKQKYFIDSASAKGFDMSSLSTKLKTIQAETGLSEVFAHIEYGSYQFVNGEYLG